MKLLLVVIISSVIKDLPATSVESEESDWSPPTDLDSVQEAISNVRVLLADITYEASQVLQDLQSKHNKEHLHDTGRLVVNTNDLLKALKFGLCQILPSFNPTQVNELHTEMDTLSLLTNSVQGLFRSLRYTLREQQLLSHDFVIKLDYIDDGLLTTKNHIEHMWDSLFR